MHACLQITYRRSKTTLVLTRLWFWTAASMAGTLLVDLFANALKSPAKVNVCGNTFELLIIILHSKQNMRSTIVIKILVML